MRANTYGKMNHLYKKYRGYTSTRGLTEEGLTNRQISVLAEEGYLERVCHGHYWMLQCGYEKPYDYKCIEACLSNPRAVISMKSACFYQGMTEQEPEYGAGDMVTHFKFGTGTVTSLKKLDQDYEVVVEFDKFGQRKLRTSFAKLQKVNK